MWMYSVYALSVAENGRFRYKKGNYNCLNSHKKNIFHKKNQSLFPDIDGNKLHLQRRQNQQPLKNRSIHFNRHHLQPNLQQYINFTTKKTHFKMSIEIAQLDQKKQTVKHKHNE